MTTSINHHYAGLTATDRGTKIAKVGEDMDKNAFLTILAAELSNLDPSGNNDSTQYVTQMAQFAQMEQLTNLNNTMTNYANNAMIGRGVTLNAYDSQGVQYTGIVRAVSTTSSGTTISVEVNENGENVYKDFDLSNVVSVLDVEDTTQASLINLNTKTSFLTATSLINKFVELSEKDDDGNYLTGQVLGVIRDGHTINVRIKLDGSEEIKEFNFEKIKKAVGSAEEI
jgi:flagellar basal-body rod modification protein FlgD